MTTTGQSFLAARTRSAPQGFGRPISRKEDARLVTGRGRFSQRVRDDAYIYGSGGRFMSRSGEVHYDPRYS